MFELVAVIAVIGVLAIVTFPRYFDISSDAGQEMFLMIKDALEAEASGKYADCAQTGAARYPATSQELVEGSGSGCMKNPIPLAGITLTITSATQITATINGKTQSWAYDPATGKVSGGYAR